MHCANVVELLLTSGVRTLLLSRKEFLGEGVLEKLYLTVGPLTTALFIHAFFIKIYFIRISRLKNAQNLRIS